MSSEISQCTTMVGRCQGEATFWLIGASNPSLSFYNDIMGLECSLNVTVFAKLKHKLKLKCQCCQVYATKLAHSWPKLDQSRSRGTENLKNNPRQQYRSSLVLRKKHGLGNTVFYYETPLDLKAHKIAQDGCID